MKLVVDAARVASGVCVVAAECIRKGLRGSFSRRDARASYEAVKGAMDRGTSKVVESAKGAVDDLGRKSTSEGVVVAQPEELFAPSKAAESKEARPFEDVQEPLAPKVALPSVGASLPTT